MVIELPDGFRSYLEDLKETELFGRTLETVVERLVSERIRELIGEGVLVNKEEEDA